MAKGPRGKLEFTVEGRLYRMPVEQGVLDVPSEDARTLVGGAGWLDWGRVGPTESRPVNPPIMTTFIDLDIGCLLFYDGQAWRDSVTGEAY